MAEGQQCETSGLFRIDREARSRVLGLIRLASAIQNCSIRKVSILSNRCDKHRRGSFLPAPLPPQPPAPFFRSPFPINPFARNAVRRTRECALRFSREIWIPSINTTAFTDTVDIVGTIRPKSVASLGVSWPSLNLSRVHTYVFSLQIFLSLKVRLLFKQEFFFSFFLFLPFFLSLYSLLYIYISHDIF